jgi:hypothetical protein
MRVAAAWAAAACLPLVLSSSNLDWPTHFKPPPLQFKPPPLPITKRNQELFVLDIFCGAGGLSFLEQRKDKPSTKAFLRRHGAMAELGIYSRWAVDLNASAIATYEANHGDDIDVSRPALFVLCASRLLRLAFSAAWCPVAGVVLDCPGSLDTVTKAHAAPLIAPFRPPRRSTSASRSL